MNDEIIERLEISILHVDKSGTQGAGFNTSTHQFPVYKEKSYNKTIICHRCDEEIEVKISSFKSATQLNNVGKYIIFFPMVLYYLATVVSQVLKSDLSSYNILNYLLLIIFPLIPAAIIGGIIGLAIYVTLGELNILNDDGYQIKSKKSKHRAKAMIVE